MTEAARLRALALECRTLALLMSLRLDRETLLARAVAYEQEASRMDQAGLGVPRALATRDGQG